MLLQSAAHTEFEREGITGKGSLALVPSHLPHLRLLCLMECDIVCDEHVEELMAAVPELGVIKQLGDNVGAMRNKHLATTYEFSKHSYLHVSHHTKNI